MRGLKILGVGLIDVDNKDFMSLFAVRLSNPKTLNTAKWILVDWCLYAIERKEICTTETNSLCCCGCVVCKVFFCQGIKRMGFHLISRFRDDVCLMYPTNVPRTGKRGSPKKFDGKVDFNNFDYSRFEKFDLSLNGECYMAILHSCFLQRMWVTSFL